MKSPCKLLYVEDDAEIRDMVSRLLRQKFYVDTAENKSNGLAKILNNDYDFILTDYNLGDGDGISMVHEAYLQTQKKGRYYGLFCVQDEDFINQKVKEKSLFKPIIVLKKPVAIKSLVPSLEAFLRRYVPLCQ